jgi:2-isopropylmalate synthase
VRPADDRNLRLCSAPRQSVITIVGKTWDLHVREDLRIPLEQNLEVHPRLDAYLQERATR